MADKNGRMNTFFRDYPAIGVAIISGLVSLVGLLLTVLLSMGYNQTMRRFDELEAESKANRQQHQDFRSSISHLEGRMIRVETLLPAKPTS